MAHGRWQRRASARFAILVRIGISSPRRKTRQRLALVPTQEDEATPRPLARESHEVVTSYSCAGTRARP
ncbi:hypothetical protein BHM03_00042213 [Ensete ventricosum]|nr:hypothetical protein BHM03_00042213 [Ensete ventricosum]